MKTPILGLLAGASLLAGAPAHAIDMPPDTMAGADELWLLCSVTEQGTSKDCQFYMPITDETERLKAGTELGYLDAHPFPIPGATPGTNVKAYVRLNAERRSNGSFKVSAPAGEFTAASGPEINDPVWVHSPTDDWTGLFTPDKVVQVGQKGQATVRCVTTRRGVLVSCWAPWETPTGWGFAESAERLLAHVQMQPLTASEQPVGGRPYQVTINFY